MIRTTVIIPNYNGLKFLKPCMESLSRQTADDFRVLVVDNGSTDGSVAWLEERGIETIPLKENKGFAAAVNMGIFKAGTPYVLLLNNDACAAPRFVEELEKAIESSGKIFSVSSRMLKAYEPSIIDDAGDMYSVLGWAYQRGTGQPQKGYRCARRVFSACAGAAIYRREVFDEIGGFDEGHFAYLEDIDVGWRAKLAGYENVYCPKAVAYHVGSGTSGSKYNPFKVRLSARNNVYLNYKNMAAWQLLLNAPALLLGTLLKYAFFVSIGFGKDYLEGIIEGLKTCRSCRKAPVAGAGFRRVAGIQAELFFGTLLYCYEFARRKTR